MQPLRRGPIAAAGGCYHGYLSAHQFGGQRRQSIKSTICPAVIDADVVMLDIAGFTQAAPERVNDVHELAGGFHAEKPDHRHPGLLRPRIERPSERCTADKRDELAPFQLIELHSVPASAVLHDNELGGISQRVG